MNKKFLCKLTSFICIFVLFAHTIGNYKALASSSIDDKLNYDENSRIADDFFSYYTTEEGTYFPDYFSGIYFLNDGSPIFYLTDTSKDIIELICSICNCSSISYRKVIYSFNELYQRMEENKKIWDEIGIICQTINIPENQVNVYFDSQSTLLNANDINLMERMDTKCNYIPYFSDEQVINTTKMAHDQTTVELSEEPLSTPDFQTRAAQALLGAPGHTLSCNGTIGFFVTYGSGKKGIITHGHTISLNETYHYLWQSDDPIGKVKYIYGRGGSKSDASLVEITNNSLNLSNQIYGTTSVIKGYVNIATALASGNRTGYFRGTTSGVKQITIDVISDKNSTRIAWSGNCASGGDSGGPIYIRTGTNAYLYGIVSQTIGSVSYGVYADSILETSANEKGVTLKIYTE